MRSRVSQRSADLEQRLGASVDHERRRSTISHSGSPSRISGSPVSSCAPWAIAVVTAKASAYAIRCPAFTWAASSTRSSVGRSRLSNRRSSRTTSRARSAPARRSSTYATSPTLIQLMIGRLTSASCTRLAAGSSPSSQARTAHESRHSVTGRVPLGDRPRAPRGGPGRPSFRGDLFALERARRVRPRHRERNRPRHQARSPGDRALISELPPAPWGQHGESYR